MIITIDIKDLGLTRQREVVLHVIRAAEEHLTANEVFNRKEFPVCLQRGFPFQP